jgi:hypothetical protein
MFPDGIGSREAGRGRALMEPLLVRLSTRDRAFVRRPARLWLRPAGRGRVPWSRCSYADDRDLEPALSSRRR